VASFERLLSPGRIGPVDVHNRIVMPPMDQNLCTDDGEITDALLDHYEQRAAGGVGLIVVETSAVAYPVGATSRHQPSISTDECVKGFEALAERVHAHGAAVFVQISHHGKTALVDTAEARPMLVPSLPLPELDPMGMARDLTIDEMTKMASTLGGNFPTFEEATEPDLAEIGQQFAAAAVRAERAGCDGVEVHAAHGYLLSTFLSPCWNQRSDGYGGSIEGRTRLLREVVEAIRTATGDGFAIAVRLDGAEYATPRPGITPELAAEHARVAQSAGADAIHVSAIGSPDSALAFTEGPLPWRPVQYRELTAVVKTAVSVPVIAVGRIEPESAESLLRDGTADFVSMGRQLLADPTLPARLDAGRPDLVRPCINCLVCVAENFWGAVPRCAVNPQLGREAPVPEPTDRPRRVVVVGAGPAGLECARVAAERGHRVTLLERETRLGGTARLSALTTPLNGQLVRYLELAARESDVDVRCGAAATAESIAALQADVVVVATGASRGAIGIDGEDLPHVRSGDDLRELLSGENSRGLGVLQRAALFVGRRLRLFDDIERVRRLSTRWLPFGRRVAVVGGGLVGVELAEFLAGRGRAVTVIHEGRVPATEMAHPRRWRTLHEAREHGVEFVLDATVVGIDTEVVTVQVGGEERRIPADDVFVATGVAPDATLSDELREAGMDVHVIGDAADVAYIEGAIRSGFDLGSRL